MMVKFLLLAFGPPIAAFLISRPIFRAYYRRKLEQEKMNARLW
jgi:hypothetical protein